MHVCMKPDSNPQHSYQKGFEALTVYLKSLYLAYWLHILGF